jgi:hypothetical protein
MSELRNMRRLEYWKTIQSTKYPHITFDLVPVTTVHEHFYFDEFVEHVKQAGFSYRIIKHTETLEDSNNV